MTNKLLTGGALAALAAALAFTAVPASAQDRHHNHDNNGSAQSDRGDRNSSNRHDNHSAPAWGSRNRGDQPQRTNTPAANQSHGQWSGRHEDQRAQANQHAAVNGRLAGWNGARATTQDRAYVDQSRNTTYVDRNRNTTYRNASRDDHRDWRTDRRDNNRTWASRDNNQRWDRNWRSNNRYDWQRYRAYNRNAYHVGRYYSPYRDYDYRRLSIGYRLAPLFFSQDYWIGDPGYYRLPDVYGPYRWVRYYDDALLVDVYSGEVVDVIYDFFW